MRPVFGGVQGEFAKARGADTMRFAYADPPYIGQAHRYVEHQEVDHKRLIQKLGEYDGWALSCSSPSLRLLIPMCPEKTRVMAWVKPFAVFKPNVGVAYAWEPVLVYGGRPRTREQDTIRDWVAVNITLERGMVGVKPSSFAFWIFEVLNMQPEDVFADLFPGTGAVTKAWDRWRNSWMNQRMARCYTRKERP